MRSSIKKQLVFLLLLFTSLVWSAISINSYYDTRSQLEELFDAQLSQSAHVLLELSSHELYEQLAFLSQNQVTKKQNSKNVTVDNSQDNNQIAVPIQIHKYEQHLNYQIWINKTQLAVRTNDAPNVPLTDLNDTFIDYKNEKYDWRVYAVSNSDGTMQVQVAGDYSERNELSSTIAMRLLLSLGLSLPILAVLILLGVRKSFAPLEKIVREMKVRKIDNLQAINTDGIPIEARPMVEALNLLFEKLEKSFDNISRFTIDAAHELRTPMAALKVNAQVALKENDVKLRDDALKQVVTGVNHTTDIVAQLLMLSRLDPDSQVIKNERPDLGLIAEEIIANITPKALEKNIDISLNAEQYAIVNGKLGMLQFLIRNIVENAIIYTPQDGIVEVSIWKEFDRILLSVSDSGPGIAVEERKDVFKRFYRGESGINIPGTGLGLSIVSRVIEIHKGSIQLGVSQYKGLQVDVQLLADKSRFINNAENKLRASG